MKQTNDKKPQTAKSIKKKNQSNYMNPIPHLH